MFSHRSETIRVESEIGEEYEAECVETLMKPYKSEEFKSKVGEPAPSADTNSNGGKPNTDDTNQKPLVETTTSFGPKEK